MEDLLSPLAKYVPNRVAPVGAGASAVGEDVLTGPAGQVQFGAQQAPQASGLRRGCLVADISISSPELMDFTLESIGLLA